MVLADVKRSGVYHVRNLSGGGELERHLEEMGFVPGCQISVVSRIAGNLIVNVKGSRVALSRELARNIVI